MCSAVREDTSKCGAARRAKPCSFCASVEQTILETNRISSMSATPFPPFFKLKTILISLSLSICVADAVGGSASTFA